MFTWAAWRLQYSLTVCGTLRKHSEQVAAPDCNFLAVGVTSGHLCVRSFVFAEGLKSEWGRKEGSLRAQFVSHYVIGFVERRRGGSMGTTLIINGPSRRR